MQKIVVFIKTYVMLESQKVAIFILRRTKINENKITIRPTNRILLIYFNKFLYCTKHLSLNLFYLYKVFYCGELLSPANEFQLLCHLFLLLHLIYLNDLGMSFIVLSI